MKLVQFKYLELKFKGTMKVLLMNRLNTELKITGEIYEARLNHDNITKQLNGPTSNLDKAICVCYKERPNKY